MAESMRVLFVASAAGDRRRAATVLPEQAPLSVTTAAAAGDAVDAVDDDDFDCVAVEHAEDGTNGLSVLRLIRDSDPAIPTVLFARDGSERVAAEAVSLDVADYVRASDADDAFAALARSCHDAAAQYRAEQDVAMLNDLARNVYERVTDGFFALDREWRFTYLNAHAEEALDVRAENVIGENVWDAFPDAVGTQFYTEYHRAMATQEPVTFREYFEPLEKTFEVRAFPSEDGLSVHFRTVVDGEGRPRGEHLMELASILSHDLSESIDEARSAVDRAAAACECEDAEFEDAREALERMDDLVSRSRSLAIDRPTPRSAPDNQ